MTMPENELSSTMQKATEVNKGMTFGIWEDINPVNKKAFKDD